MAVHNVTATLVANEYTSMAQYELPNNKFMYESDGTTIIFYANGVEYNPGLTAQETVNMNAYWKSSGGGHSYHNNGVTYIFVFPELRDITHVLVAGSGWDNIGVTGEYSRDTVNGSDGTWTPFTIYSKYQSPLSEVQYRTLMRPVDGVTAVRSVKFNVGQYTGWMFGDKYGQYAHIHLYGDKAATVNRLAFWHPTQNYEVDRSYFDWQEFEPGTSSTMQFRVKNCSATYRAEDTILSTSSLLDPYDYTNEHTFSIGGGGYTKTLNVGTLTAGQISNVVTMKRTFLSGSVGRMFSLRLLATPTWVEYIKSVSASLNVYDALNVTPARTQHATANLSTVMYLTDASLYRSGLSYNESAPYIGSRISGIWAGNAPLTASPGGALYTDAYRDQFGVDGIWVIAQTTGGNAQAQLTASIKTDNYPDVFNDAYGNDGLFAHATVV